MKMNHYLPTSSYERAWSETAGGQQALLLLRRKAGRMIHSGDGIREKITEVRESLRRGNAPKEDLTHNRAETKKRKRRGSG